MEGDDVSEGAMGDVLGVGFVDDLVARFRVCGGGLLTEPNRG